MVVVEVTPVEEALEGGPCGSPPGSWGRGLARPPPCIARDLLLTARRSRGVHPVGAALEQAGAMRGKRPYLRGGVGVSANVVSSNARSMKSALRAFTFHVMRVCRLALVISPVLLWRSR